MTDKERGLTTVTEERKAERGRELYRATMDLALQADKHGFSASMLALSHAAGEIAKEIKSIEE